MSLGRENLKGLRDAGKGDGRKHPVSPLKELCSAEERKFYWYS